MKTEKALRKGNEALAEGAIRAGVRFFAGYPITPQNEVPEYMAAHMADNGGAFVQAESEVAAINMVYGAAATGTRSMTSSSSPGVSLKQEGITYLASADLPCLIVNVMRGGPGLGSISGAQGDYFQATRGGGNGDYHIIVLAPNSVEELGNFPKLGIELAEKYRMPCMILADGILGQMMESMAFNFEPVDPNKLGKFDWAVDINKQGRGKSKVFSYKGDNLIADVTERAKRYGLIEKTEARYEERNAEDCDILLVAYGLSSRACLEAVNMASSKGLKVGLFRPITLWPFPSKRLAELAQKAKGVLVVEQSLGQLVQDVKLAVGDCVPVGLNAYPAGGQPDGTQILTAAQSLLTGKKEGLFDLQEHAANFTYNCARDLSLGVQGDAQGGK
ncbi:MAG: 3-methyl-2-oxobutanoate dehydrogenase subunit VorB [Elusimicrobiaceae bacterium]|nr:3-methyl-2-oxobutanoate dehydrogenase subunit VorB [Elusimicrobiaceae bacterium]